MTSAQRIITVTLSHDELWLGKDLSAYIFQKRRDAGSLTRTGTDFDVRRGVIGNWSEIALSRLTNKSWSALIGNGHRDVGFVAEVRASEREDPGLLLYDTDARDFPETPFVLARVREPHVDFLGWYWVEQGTVPEFASGSRLQSPGYIVPFKKLHSMDDLDMSDPPATGKRTCGQMAEACETASKRVDPKGIRRSEHVEIVARLERAAEFLRLLAPHSAAIAKLLEGATP